jgi:hypothetical protein
VRLRHRTAAWRGGVGVVMAGALIAGSVHASAAPSTGDRARQAKAHAVVAVIENVNVYHREFAAPERVGSPSAWLAGYPRSAEPLRLHLHAKDYGTARQADDPTWAAVHPGQLYYIPGTRIAGFVYLPSALDSLSSVNVQYPPPPYPQRAMIDTSAHGTSVASVAAGTKYGTCPDCDIVVVATDNLEDGLAWAARQPWIDVISNSWGGPFGVPTQATIGHPERGADQNASPGSLAAASAGKAVVFGSGNGVTDLGPQSHITQHSLTWHEPYAGPPWVLAVGAAKARTGQPTNWHNIPVDVIAQGEERPSAASGTLDGETDFLGTSCSAPIAAGVLAEALLRTRQQTGDAGVGSRGGSLLKPARPISRGPAADGRLTYIELFDAARAVAQWRAFDPTTVASDPIQAFATPTTPLGYAYEGSGLLDRASVLPLTSVLAGQVAAPPRPEMQQWLGIARNARTARWGSEPSPR